MDPGQKRIKIRERLDNGLLTKWNSATFANNPGLQTPPTTAIEYRICGIPGHLCAGCCENKPTMEISFVGRETVCFHNDCYDMWKEESTTPRLRRN